MTVDNKNMLDQLSAAFKDITTTNKLGASILQPAYFNKYVLAATRDKTILSEARLVKMTASVQNIDRVGFSGRILEKAVENVEGTTKTPDFAQEKLTAEEFIATVGITDKALRRSIEGTSFNDTLISMMGQQAGEDWETLAVGGAKTKYTTGSLLKSQDGWIEKSTNKIYGTGTGKDFDKAGKVTDMLKAMLKAYPRNYLKNRSNLRYYLNSDQFDTYIDEVGERPTVAGDDAISNNVARPYKGIPVREAPVLNDSEILDTVNGYGNVAMLQNPNNMCFGIFYKVTIEPDRIPKLRRTDYILTQETDQGYENPNVSVIALADVTKPTG
jgi:hypothetical protein